MNLEQLRLLRAISEHGTLTAAAERLHLSQPAATHQIHQLEKELGLPLFARSARRLQLTSIGERVLARARIILDESDAIHRDIAAIQNLDLGEVRMGGGPTATVHLLPNLISRFHARHPGIRFYVKEAHTREVVEWVAHGALDIGVTTLPCAHPRLAVFPWQEDHIVLVGWPGSPLSRGPLNPNALNGAPMIYPGPDSPLRERVETAFQQVGVEPDVVMELHSPEAAKAHVMAGLGYTAIGTRSVQEELADGRLVMLDLPALNLSRQLGIIVRRDLTLLPAVQAFLDHLLSDKQ